MGTVLEMISRKVWAAVATFGLLTACGPLANGSLGADLMRGQLGKLSGSTPAPAAPAPDLANAAPGDILLVTIVSRNAVAPLTKLAQNGDTVTWVSPGRVSMTLKEGILIATRGLNEDLMGADVTGVRAALSAGGGTVTRTHSYLDSKDQIRLDQMTCTIASVGVDTIAAATGSRQASKYTEDCTGQTLKFSNSYWLDAPGGAIVQSLQVVAPSSGYLQINPL